MAEEFRTVRMVEGSSAETYDEVVSLLGRTGIAGGCGFVRGTAKKDEGRRIVMECKGSPHDGVGASVVLSFGDDGRLTIGFGRETGRLVYVKDGEEYRLASFQSGGKTVRVDAVDIGRSTRTVDGITLSLVDGAGFECARIVGTRR